MQRSKGEFELWSHPSEVPAAVTDAAYRAQLRLAHPCGTFEGERLCDGTGRPMLFVHGLGHDLSDWRLLFPLAVRRGFRAMAFDLPGFGLSTRNAGLKLADLVAALRTACEACETSPVVVASSMGGHVALLAALQGAPMSAVIGLAPGGLVRFTDAMKRSALALYSEEARLSRNSEAIEAGVDAIFVRPSPERDRLAARKLAEHRSESARAHARCFADIVRDVVEHPVAERLNEVPVPVTLVVGDGDTLVPAPLVVTAADAAGLPVEIMADTGHVPMLEAPDETFALIARAAFGVTHVSQ